MQTTDTNNFFRTDAELAGERNRALKAERTKEVGNPIDLGSKILNFAILGNEVWTAESAKIIRKIGLETGKTLQIYKGHSGPVTSVVIYQFQGPDGAPERVLISGSWDKTIRVWDVKTKEILSETQAHDDFVKSLVVIPGSDILASGSSDKTAKLWDLTSIISPETRGQPLHQLASLSGHRRPVDSLSVSKDAPEYLLTGDSMGVIKVWKLEERWQSSPSSPPTVKAAVERELEGHRTGVNALSKTDNYLWSASTDETIIFRQNPHKPASVLVHTIEHAAPVKSLLDISQTHSMPYLVTGSGDAIRLYDISELVDAENGGAPLDRDSKARLLSEVDAHWQPVTQLAVWNKLNEGLGRVAPEPWVVSSSLDGTLRRWKLDDLIAGNVKVPKGPGKASIAAVPKDSALTEEEERELAELMDE